MEELQVSSQCFNCRCIVSYKHDNIDTKDDIDFKNAYKKDYKMEFVNEQSI